MFKFLKDKLKKAVSKFSKDVEEEFDKEEKVEAAPVVKKEEPKVKEPKPKPTPKPEPKEEPEEEEKPEKAPKEEEPNLEPEPEAPVPEVKKEEPALEPPKEEIKEQPEEEQVKEEQKVEEPAEQPKEEKKKGFFGFLKKEKKEEPTPEPSPETPQPTEKKGFLGKIGDMVTKKSVSESKFNDLFWELEIVMLENNVALEVIERIKEELKAKLVDQKVDRGKVSDIVLDTLKDTIKKILDIEKIPLLERIRNKQEKPYVIALFGVNGAGKTTNLVKVGKLLEKNNISTVIAACDTFRAAAIQQLEEHAKNVDIKVIKHDYGSDAAAVAFDAIKHAKAKGKDVVLIDTAGRQHSNSNLMDELKKLVRISNPDLKIFIGESITGNDCIEQAQKFNDAVGIDAIILTKADIDEKGGAAISISYVINKPILFFGTGQDYEDLKEFDKDFVMQNLGLV